MMQYNDDHLDEVDDKSSTPSRENKLPDESSPVVTATTGMTTTLVSTIYDPKDDGNCCPTSITTNISTSPTSNNNNNNNNADYCYSSSINNRKTFLEHIKKLSFKLGGLGAGAGVSKQDIGDTCKGQRHLKLLYCSFCCLLLILFALAASVVFLMQFSAQSNVREIIVDGEFQILNQPYQYELFDLTSPSYNEFFSSIIGELDRLFRRSEVGEYYNRSEVLEVTPDMTVKCLVLFQNSDNINVGQIGLAFLRSLRLQHGHTWLGNYTINVQSIGFQIRGEEGEWGEWSQWQGCDNETDSVATRTRKCYTRDTHQATNIDRCLLIPGNKGDLDIMPCRIFKTSSTRGFTKMPTPRISTVQNLLPSTNFTNQKNIAAGS